LGAYLPSAKVFRMAKPTKGELRYRLYIRIIEVFGMVTHRAIPWLGLYGCGYLAYLSIKSLSGQVTLADIAIRFISDFRTSRGVAYLFGLGGIGYGVRQRKLRRDHIEQSSRTIEHLEKLTDPGRSSSRLTRRGETRPEDRP
jgi:hypothetical protein